jgi:UTP--glucose-1-phosphate uridylyltransferase
VLKEMLKIFEEYQGSIIALKRVSKDEIERYGVIKAEKIVKGVYHVRDIMEKPKSAEAYSNLAIMGRYVLTPEIFEELELTPTGVGGEIQLTDALRRLLQRQAIYGYEIEGEYYDAGTLLGWIEATVALTLKDPKMGPELRSYLSHLPH